MSALHGDNVITRSDRTPWFDGPPLLEYLETVQREAQHHRRRRSASRCSSCCGPTTSSAAMPDRSCRAPSASATASRPGRRAARRASSRIVTFDGDLDLAFAPMSVTLTLDDEIDISRGDVLTVDPPLVGQRFEAESSGWTSGRSIPAASTCSSRARGR